MSQERAEYQTGALTPEIVSVLSEPFPEELHETKTMGGQAITYVSWNHYVERLNQVVPDWQMGQPIMQIIGGKLVMGIPLTIAGVTRINFGDETEDRDSYGTAGTNAFAQAFKRTCALFGLGLYLYNGGASPPTRSQRADVSQDAPTDARQVEVFFGKHKGKMLGEIAAEDDDYLEWLASSRFKPETDSAEVLQRAARAILARKHGIE